MNDKLCNFLYALFHQVQHIMSYEYRHESLPFTYDIPEAHFLTNHSLCLG